jgi:hypothetical protein
MSLYKQAQFLDANDFENFGDEDEVVLYEEKPSMEDVVELHQPDNAMEITFKLPPLPGSDADMPLEVSTEDPVEVESKGKKDKDDNKVEELEVQDPWKPPSPAGILNWVHDRLQNLPRHSGRETTGIERTIAVMKRINNEISKAIANDYNGEVDIGRLEEARKEIFDGIHRLEEAKEKLDNGYKGKKADLDENGLVKEAKQDRIGGIIITVPILISRIAKVCINSMVSGGKDIEKVFDAQSKEWNLDKREQAELMELLENMGYSSPRRDRAYPADHQMEYKSSDNFDLSSNYPA